MKPRLQLWVALRRRHYRRKADQAYCTWVKRYIWSHDLRHPADMAEPEVNAFVTYLAVEAKVGASMQNQAHTALLFLYRHVMVVKSAIWVR